MPTVQYEPGNWQVQPSEAQFRAPDLTTGAGYLAEGLGHVAAQADQIVQISAQTQARAQALQDSQAVSKVLAGYKVLPGQQAVDAQPAVIKQIGDIQTAGQKAMTTPMMQRMYTEHAAPIFASATGEVYGHAVQQVHVAAGQQFQAETSAAQDQAAGLYSDPDKLGVALGAVRASAAREALFNGVQGAAADEYVKGKAGESVVNGIKAALANKNVDLAIELNKRYGGENLPFAMRNAVTDEMAAPLITRQYGAIFKASAAGSTTAPMQSDDGDWIVPGVAGPAAGTGLADNYRMPVAGGHVTDDYADHQARGSAGVDIAVPVNTPIKSVAVGTVVQVGKDDRSGNFVMIRHPDGIVSSYAHMGNVSVADGDQVNANTVLGTVGLTGHTTGAHVHLRMRNAQGNDVDPMKVLGGKPGIAASATSPSSLPQYDEATVISNIKAMGLSPEMEAGAIDYARTQMRQAKVAENDTYMQAADKVQEWTANYALAHGNTYPPPEAIPSSLINTMRPGDAAAFKLQIAKSREAEMKGDGKDLQSRAYADLQVLRFDHPDQFLAIDPATKVGDLSAGQWNEFRVQQAEGRARAGKPQTWEPYKETSEAVAIFQKFNPGVIPVDLKKQDPVTYSTILGTVKARADAFVAQAHRPPTTSEWQEFTRQATRSVPIAGFFGTSAKPIYQVKASEIPDATRQRIVMTYARMHGGAQPSEAEIVQAYQIIMP